MTTLPSDPPHQTVPPQSRRRRAVRLVTRRPAVPRPPRLTATLGRLPVASRGVGPFLLSLDVLAWALAASAVSDLDRYAVALLVLTVGLLAQAGAYRSRLTLSVLEQWPRLASLPLVAAATIVAVDTVLPTGAPDLDLLRTAAASALTIVVLRAIGYATVRAARASGAVGHRTLLLGAGQVGAQLARTLQERPQYGLRPVGFLDSDPLLSDSELPVPVVGGNEDLARVVREFGIEDVIVAFGSLKEDQLVEVLRTCDRLDVEIFFVPRLFEVHTVDRDMDHVWGLPLVRQRRAAFRTASWRLKRAMDVIVSAAALLLLAPLLLVLALAVRLEGGPGVIFRQTRVGLDGRPFELLKFRSLRPADPGEGETRWNIADDARVGPVGRLLRVSSFDEFPQLWNILRGDMSLVGPRPERPFFVESFARTLPRYVARHRVPAGLTGWAQVHGLRGDTSIADRARFDNYYIENWSLALDVRILLLTAVSVFTRRGR